MNGWMWKRVGAAAYVGALAALGACGGGSDAPPSPSVEVAASDESPSAASAPAAAASIAFDPDMRAQILKQSHGHVDIANLQDTQYYVSTPADIVADLLDELRAAGRGEDAARFVAVVSDLGGPEGYERALRNGSEQSVTAAFARRGIDIKSWRAPDMLSAQERAFQAAASAVAASAAASAGLQPVETVR